MEVDGGGASAARRRRERRLRSWWRHEQQSVRMALNAAAHHSAAKVAAGEEYSGAVTVGYVAAPVPLLAEPLLAGAAGEAVDARTLRFLVARSLAEKEDCLLYTSPSPRD